MPFTGLVKELQLDYRSRMPQVPDSRINPAVLLLAFTLIIRALLLQFPDLIDPTESRYAVVAQSMVQTGNWITPMLPLPEGDVPYLGKPPLHFWLTALSYDVFGIKAWTSRLPSFLDILLLLWLTALMARRLFGAGSELSSVFILFSSVLPFFVAGASVTDVTLTASVTAGVVLLHAYLTCSSSSKLLAGSAAVCAALAFLTKGPVGLVLIALPFLLAGIIGGTLRAWLSRLPWLLLIAIFLVITVPWFILGEQENPGFLKYFFWNENIARYLFKNYGDRYGSGHRYPHGASWVMLMIAFLPWTFAWLRKPSWSNIRAWAHNTRADTAMLFVTCWAVSTPLFFTLVRQLHILYILPALPPLAMLTSETLRRRWQANEPGVARAIAERAPLILISTAVLACAFGAHYHFSWTTIACATATLAMGLILHRFLSDRCPADSAGLILRCALIPLIIFLLLMTNLVPVLDSTKSSENMVRQIALAAPCVGETPGVHLVGTSTSNTFSHYWTARNMLTQLGQRVDLRYVSPEDAKTANVCHYLIRSNWADAAPASIQENFALIRRSGDWAVYRRRE